MADNWDLMTDEQRIAKCHFDFMRNEHFALLSGIVLTGDVVMRDDMPTAATNGYHCYYGRAFMRQQNNKQARWVVAHENFHKALRHCLPMYEQMVKRYPRESNIAMDYVVNGLIEQADPGHTFIEHPVGVTPYLDPKYYDWSFPKVLTDLIKNPPPSKGGKGGGQGEGVDSFDEHIPGEVDPKVVEKIEQQINDALHQGEILRQQLKARSKSGAGGSLEIGQIAERQTNWREHLLDFVSSVLKGNDIAKWSRINTRIFAATQRKVILPTLWQESVGHVCINADTSGSMYGVYPVLFGEIARIIELVRPEKVTLIWWDTRVAKVQTFNPADYASIRGLLSPGGGGGTDPQVAVDYINQKKLDPQCVIWLTDGEIGDEPTDLHVPQIWGVVDGTFTSKFGKTVHINSLMP